MFDQPIRFDPPRRQGSIVHISAMVVFSIAAIALLLQTSGTELGSTFLFYFLGALLFAAPIPFLAYRLYALHRSGYVLERDGIRIKWGFRIEDIPMTEILWVRLVEDLKQPIPLPWPRWPGAVVGIRRQRDIGAVEFLAGDTKRLVLIGTPEKIFAISPRNRNAFLQSYQDQTELGSLSPIPAYSVFPSFLLADVWRSPVSRISLILSLVFSLALFIWVGLAVPELGSVSLGFSVEGGLLPTVPAVQLFLLPVLNILLLLAGLVLASYFHRQDKDHPLTYVIWISSSLMGILFLGAVYFILQNG